MKILNPDSEEADIYHKLHRLDPTAPNHTLPCDIIRSETNQSIVIMPLLMDLMSCDISRWDRSTLLRHFHQILEVGDAHRPPPLVVLVVLIGVLARESTSCMTSTSLIGCVRPRALLMASHWS